MLPRAKMTRAELLEFRKTVEACCDSPDDDTSYHTIVLVIIDQLLEAM